jgi:hypothetical protein
MIDLVLPDGESGDAAAFTQNGKFLLAGHFEECEKIAIRHGGLYCWIYRGYRPLIRSDYADDSMDDE